MAKFNPQALATYDTIVLKLAEQERIVASLKLQKEVLASALFGAESGDGEEVSPALTETDRQTLKAIHDHGGVSGSGELGTMLGISKEAAWQRIYKLRKMKLIAQGVPFALTDAGRTAIAV